MNIWYIPVKRICQTGLINIENIISLCLKLLQFCDWVNKSCYYITYTFSSIHIVLCILIYNVCHIQHQINIILQFTINIEEQFVKLLRLVWTIKWCMSKTISHTTRSSTPSFKAIYRHWHALSLSICYCNLSCYLIDLFSCNRFYIHNNYIQ